MRHLPPPLRSNRSLLVAALPLTALAACVPAYAQAGPPPGGAPLSPASLPVLAILSAGLFLGLRHALEADHLAAVSTIVTERRNPFSSALVGGLWGLGHTVSLLVVGLAVVLLNLRITGKTALALEFGVALMLIGLGLNVLWKLARGGRVHIHAHAHGDHVHLHPHVHEAAAVAHEHEEPARSEPHAHHGFRVGARPLWIGMVHGFAGSAALMLLVLAQIRTPALALAYIGVFGLGSIGGMMAMSTLVGLPLHFTARRYERAHSGVRALSGLFSLAIGIHLFWEIGFVEGLFR